MTQKCWRCGEDTPNDPRTCDRCREILEAEHLASGRPHPWDVFVELGLARLAKEGESAA